MLRAWRRCQPHPGERYLVCFTCPKFTSLCPVTGQPDFAHLVIDYVPKERLVESKSLKLFLGSFRNHGAFHEDCTLLIAKRLEAALEPVWLRIGGYWYPRGGIPIDVFYQSGAPPRIFGARSRRAAIPRARVARPRRGAGRSGNNRRDRDVLIM